MGFPQCNCNKSEGSRTRAVVTNESTAQNAPLDKESIAGTRSFTVADWIVEIKEVWGRDAASTLDQARVVSAAKTDLRQQYGQWSRLWKSGHVMSISKSTADQLALIGQQMGGLDSQTPQKSAVVRRNSVGCVKALRLHRVPIVRFSTLTFLAAIQDRN